MPNYNYVLNAPFESDKFFEHVEKDMNDGKIKFAGGRGYVVNDLIEVNHKIKGQLDYMKPVFYSNMCSHSITPLVGYIQTILLNSGSILDSDLIRLYIEFEVCKYLTTTTRITDTIVKNTAENMRITAVEKIKAIIS